MPIKDAAVPTKNIDYTISLPTELFLTAAPTKAAPQERPFREHLREAPPRESRADVAAFAPPPPPNEPQRTSNDEQSGDERDRVEAADSAASSDASGATQQDAPATADHAAAPQQESAAAGAASGEDDRQHADSTPANRAADESSVLSSADPSQAGAAEGVAGAQDAAADPTSLTAGAPPNSIAAATELEEGQGAATATSEGDEDPAAESSDSVQLRASDPASGNSAAPSAAAQSAAGAGNFDDSVGPNGGSSVVALDAVDAHVEKDGKSERSHRKGQENRDHRAHAAKRTTPTEAATSQANGISGPADASPPSPSEGPLQPAKTSADAVELAAPPPPAQADQPANQAQGPSGEQATIGAARPDAAHPRAPAMLDRTPAPTANDGRPLSAAQQSRLVQRVAKAFDVARVRGEATIRLRLSPPELGSVRLEMQVVSGALAARMEVESHRTRDVLLENLGALRQRLAEQNVRVDRFDVDLLGQGAGQDLGHDDRPARQPPRGETFHDAGGPEGEDHSLGGAASHPRAGPPTDGVIDVII